MKLFNLFIIIILASGTCSSQIKKGVIPVGGNVNLFIDSDEYGDETISGWINPKVGYYVTDRDAFGMSLFYYYYRGEVSYDSSKIINKEHRYGLFPFWRRNLFFDEVKGMYLETRLGFEKSDREPKSVDLSFNLRPGFYYFVTKRLAIETTIGYLEYRHQIVDYGNLGSGTHNTLNVSFGLSSIDLGVQYYFNKD